MSNDDKLILELKDSPFVIVIVVMVSRNYIVCYLTIVEFKIFVKFDAIHRFVFSVKELDELLHSVVLGVKPLCLCLFFEVCQTY